MLSRDQQAWLPECLDDYVNQHHPVRAIDAWVESLQLEKLGFAQSQVSRGFGQPAYHPKMLLRLYVYGYQHRIRSSRRLEAELRRNLELIWLCQKATPCYKTIADFRKDNVDALKAAQRKFVSLCQELELFGGQQVAIDGSYLKADANASTIHSEKQLQRQLQQMQVRIDEYYRQLDEFDAVETEAEELAEVSVLKAKMDYWLERQKEKKEWQEKLEASGDSQISEVDSDARLLKKNGETTPGYNVQIVVDDKHKLIVAEQVTQDGNDKQQLQPMMTAAETLCNDELKGLADSGYHSAEQLDACEQKGFEVVVAEPQHASRKGRGGRFGRDAFNYDAEADVYVCPADETLKRGGTIRNKNKQYVIYRASTAQCQACYLSEQCLSPKARSRTIHRSIHEASVERNRQRLKDHPAQASERGSIVEHPFGIFKHNWQMRHFMMRTLPKCQGEFSLMALCYNFKRALNLVGFEALMSYCAQN